MQRTRYGNKRFAIANKRNYDDRRTRVIMLNRGNPSSSAFLQQRGVQVMMMMMLAEYRGHQKKSCVRWPDDSSFQLLSVVSKTFLKYK